MNTIWKAVFGLSTIIVAANCLTCRQCSVGIFGSCLFGSDAICANSTESCYTGEAQFNATGSLTLHTRGCLDSDLCGLTLTGSVLGGAYTSAYKCCVTDLCNGATSVQLSAALCAAILLPLWEFWEL
ncbi:lymphocyte antigen-6, epidermis [Poeciliopsis prolifica]|uniref:lymphocyte antigen-6, epidermis n=1 Tax=Poeciliopsis prolifica TaxID=188132 RepID=UPI002413F8CD|nr:lymphocyte antigen-6, epidermis [Poeciliopsis prolifica]